MTSLKSIWVLLMVSLMSCIVIGVADSDKRETNHDNVCDTKECIVTAATIIESIDPEVDPCENFYDFACGGWFRQKMIPPNQNSVTTLLDTEKHLAAARRLLEQNIDPLDLSSVNKAKMMYASCMRYAQRTETDKSIKDIVKSTFGTWPLTVKDWDESAFQLEDFLTKAFYLGVFPLTKLVVAVNITEDNGHVIFNHLLTFNKPVFGLPDTSYLDTPNGDATLVTYMKEIYNDALQFGIENEEGATNDIFELVKFEKALNQISNVANNEEVNFTLTDLNIKYGKVFNWSRFLLPIVTSPEVGITDFTELDNVTIFSEKYFANLTELLFQTPARTVANYIIWSVYNSLENVLVEDSSKIKYMLRSIVYGIQSDPSPEESCITYVSGAFNLILHRLLYTDKFPPDEIKTVYKIMNEVQKEFDILVSEHEWIDNQTIALIKLKNSALRTDLMFYEQSMNDTLLENYYLNVTVQADTFVQNVVAEKRESVLRNLRLLRQPFKRSTESLPHEMVAQNFYPSNTMEYTSMVFEPPSFVNNVPGAVNYGGLGMIYGHEIIHAFDNLGMLFNDEGNVGEWWSNETANTFLMRTQCLEKQYNKYYYQEGEGYVNGSLTLSENIGDNGGIKLAYRAYKRQATSRRSNEPKLPGLNYTEDQLFFINFGHIWCSLTNKALAQKELTNDAHSPKQFRVLGTLQNSKEFARAFNCPVGSPMNPENKCEVW